MKLQEIKKNKQEMIEKEYYKKIYTNINKNTDTAKQPVNKLN